ncbi:substrate-binding domain-containing protein [Desulfobacter curvatus]|uniref:substrate-binding domain-containing protein n=1 Tax=Desulfobacter curvatus TaxID=2290 RepID=UPI00035DC1DC|nr:substrate-binding domain-containing protein [Desulfobacter curvatus]
MAKTSNRTVSVSCRLKELRTQKKMTQSELAGLVGIKRQAVYDIEAGRYLPNTGVALAMAQVLGCRVEDIFYQAAGQARDVVLVDEEFAWGPRVNIAKVRERHFAYPLVGTHARMEDMGAADGLLEPGQARAKILLPEERVASTALLLGCDPAFSVLGHRVRETPGNAGLNVRFASSQQAVIRVAAGQAHIAGTHMHTRGGDDGNKFLVTQTMKDISGFLIAFSAFEEGLLVAPGNPKGIQGVAHLARKDVRLANREEGAALRSLLDDLLEEGNIPATAILGYEYLVHSHAQGAEAVRHHVCDVALGLRAVAVTYGLDFIPLSHVRCDLVIPSDLMTHPGVAAALDIIQTRAFREELACLPGYETSDTGRIIAEL